MKQLFTLIVSSALCTGALAQATIDRYLSDPLTYTNIVTSSDQVNNPRDLDFKPKTHELWVMLRGTSGGSMVIVQNAGLPNQTDQYKKDSHSSHFMVQASAMAFSDNGEFAAVSEVQNTASPTSTFMGPGLWNADPNIFATVFQNDWVSGMPLGSHIDMLHQSPYAMGIAADSAKVYWVMDGHFGNIVRYDYVQDHGPGYDNHGAGKIWRYTDVDVTRVPNIPSHMVLDKANGWLYFIDGGPKQIKRLNVNSGDVAGNLTVPSTSNEPLAGYYDVQGATVEIIDTWTTQPSGIDYADGRLIVGDHTNGDIRIYDVTGTPTQLGIIPTGQASIMGVKVGPDGHIWFVNNEGDKVVRIDPLPLANDAAITSIIAPVTVTARTDFYSITDALCGSTIDPVVTLANQGNNDLMTVDIHYTLDGGTPSVFNWNGTLAPGSTVDVTLPTAVLPAGPHLFHVWTELPNGAVDANGRDDEMEGSFRSIDPILPVPFSEGFDEDVFPPASWDYVHFNPNNYMTRNATTGGFDNSDGCLKMDHYSGEMDITGQMDYLLMPRVDLSTASVGTTLEFAIAYRQYNSSSVDRWMVKASLDCGDNWITLYDKEGADLSTGPVSTGAFTPTAAQWRTEYVDLSAVLGSSDVLLMFQTESNYGNNIYMDDIRIANVVGIEEQGAASFSVFPNPNAGDFSVRFNGTMNGPVDLRVLGVDGTVVHQHKWSASSGAVLEMDLGAAAQGSYLVELTNASGERHRMPVVIH